MENNRPDVNTDETNVLNNIVSRETILSGTSIRKMYALFRKDGIGRIDSLYNAAYLTCHNKYEESFAPVKDKYVNVHNHPIAWTNDKKKLYKHNRWSLALKILDGAAGVIRGVANAKKGVKAFFRKIGYIPRSMDNSARAIRAFFRVSSRIVLPFVAVLFAFYAGSTIASQMKEEYSLGVYIDGEYVGNTLSLNDIVDMKHTYESNLSIRYGTPVVLECKIDFAPQMLDSINLIAPGDMSIFDVYLKNYTDQGYGLYIDNKLAAVTYVQKWFDDAVEECIAQQKANYMAENSVSEEEIDRFVYNNNITIIADTYPKSYFLSQAEVRRLFALPELDAEEYDVGLLDVYNSDNINNTTKQEFTSTLELDYSNLTRPEMYSGAGNGISLDSSVMTGAVTVDIAMVKAESEHKEIPHGTEYVYDENLPEGIRRLISTGRNGEKIIYYKSTYQSGKLVKQEVSGEEILKQPRNKVVRIGTMPLAEGEKSVVPTGTYIWPYGGNISSYYGWRILRGQNNFHQGLDIYGPRGEYVYASDGGEVIEVSFSNGYGKYCKIQHDEDTVTRYAHCDTIEVEVGDFVAQGDIIGTLGDTGNATGVHVHFEIIENGTTVDPIPYLPER